MKNVLFSLAIVILFFLSSCDSGRVYETNLEINENNWKKEDTLLFEFEIPDSNTAYNLYYNVRYTNMYPYYNLFTRYFIYDSSGTLLKSPAVAEDMYLFDIKTGEPYGKGLGDIYDQRISFLKNHKFPAKGSYRIKVVQYMRKEPLPGMVSFGIRVENSTLAENN